MMIWSQAVGFDASFAGSNDDKSTCREQAVQTRSCVSAQWVVNTQQGRQTVYGLQNVLPWASPFHNTAGVQKLQQLACGTVLAPWLAMQRRKRYDSFNAVQLCHQMWHVPGI